MPLTFPQHIDVIDVTLRDGIQHEEMFLPTETKLWIANRLIEAGFRRFEVGTFSHVKYVPQFKDIEHVLAGLPKRTDVEYTVLALNTKACERTVDALDKGAQIDRVLCGQLATSEAYARKNMNRTHEELFREAEQNDPVLRGRVIQGIADPAIFDESRGESIAAMMERGPNFLHWMPGDHTRLAGKMQMHYRLNFDGEGRPMLQVFNTCKHFIRTIPNLVYDESNVEDIDTRQEDHIYDECRYVLMENPISPPRHTSAPPVLDDPLELHRKAKFLRV